MRVATKHQLDEVERRYAQMRSTVRERFPDADPIALELSFYLLHSVNRIQAHLSDIADRFGLTLPGFNVLGLLSHTDGQGMPLNEVGRFLLVSRANVTGLIDSLEKKGLVQRMAHPKDRRVRLARITKKGETVLATWRPRYFAAVRTLTAGVPPQDKKTVIRILADWNNAMNRAYRKKDEH